MRKGQNLSLFADPGQPMFIQHSEYDIYMAPFIGQGDDILYLNESLSCDGCARPMVLEHHEGLSCETCSDLFCIDCVGGPISFTNAHDTCECNRCRESNHPCVECGSNTLLGSGGFVNRVPTDDGWLCGPCAEVWFADEVEVEA